MYDCSLYKYLFSAESYESGKVVVGSVPVKSTVRFLACVAYQGKDPDDEFTQPWGLWFHGG